MTTSPATKGVVGWLGQCARAELVVLADLWGVDPRAVNLEQRLASAMTTSEQLAILIGKLDPAARAALVRVQSLGGSADTTLIEREFGVVRPHVGYPSPRAYLLALNEAPSPVEWLYLFGLIQIEREHGVRRYSIPVDLLAALPAVPPHSPRLNLTPASAPPLVSLGDPRRIERRIVALLSLAQAGVLEVESGGGLSPAAARRLLQRWGEGSQARGQIGESRRPEIRFLRELLAAAGLIRLGADGTLRPTRAALDWLRAPRTARLSALLDAWLRTPWDELAGLLGFRLRRRRDPGVARRSLLDILAQIPAGQWVAWAELRAELRRAMPDFARPDGNYDTWGLTDRFGRPADGFLRWDEVEGELIEAIAGACLHWLGLVDVGAAPAPLRGDPEISQAFRLNPWGQALLNSVATPGDSPPAALRLGDDLGVLVPPEAEPFARFQIGRIALWVAGGDIDEPEVYQLTRASVEAALDRGIGLEQIISFLNEAAGDLDERAVAMLRLWAEQHGRLTIRTGALLQAEDPALLEQIRQDSSLRLPEHSEPGHDMWLLRPGDAIPFVAALRRRGYGVAAEISPPDGGPFSPRDLTILAAALAFYRESCARLGHEGEPVAGLAARLGDLISQGQRETAARIAADAIAALNKGLNATEPPIHHHK